jgi:transglutaminase-like putative cysteine protease
LIAGTVCGPAASWMMGRRLQIRLPFMTAKTMSDLYQITHRTSYRYTEPVRFGVHRVLFRPRDSHEQRVLATDLRVSPRAEVRLIQDPHSNSVALVQPLDPATVLEIVSSFTIEHVHTLDAEPPMDPAALRFPFDYASDDRLDLEHYLRPHHTDPDGTLDRWARQFVVSSGDTYTRVMLTRMNADIHNTLRYRVRHEEGTQAPLVTLALGGGTCRDFALLMIEALRRLGVAARFVSGYLYDPAIDGSGPASIGAGATHAWLQVYLPGPGWVAFDPTNNLQGAMPLIRVGVARHPAQAAPVAGSWFGKPEAYLGMAVDVRVARLGDSARPATALPAAAQGAPGESQALHGA